MARPLRSPLSAPTQAASALAARLEAEAGTAATPEAMRRAVLPVLKEALDGARRQARLKLEGGAGGLAAARLLSGGVDAIVCALWSFAWTSVAQAANPTEAERMSLLAVGGYGRSVLAPWSDLDLLFLRPWKPTAAGESVTEFVLYALWDLGLKVGHASRTITETVRACRDDMTVRTAVLEARLLDGDPALFEDLRRRFLKEVVRGTARAFVTAKLAERDARHARTGASRYLVEPNVKDGKGGLRDLHTLFWIARYLDPEHPQGEEALKDILTARDRRAFAAAFDFFWAVRAHMHIVSGRAEERLSFDLQPEIARRMGYRDRADESAVERFMRRYFLMARDVGALTRTFCARLEADQTKPTLGLSRLLPVGRERRKPVEGAPFEILSGRLALSDPGAFEADPLNLFRLFLAADEADLDLHPDAFAAVVRSLGVVNSSLRGSAEAADLFLEILARGRHAYRILSLMNESGLLGRYLPEFGRIAGQTQLNRHHAYTVDEHTLRAVGVINDIAQGKLKEDHPLATTLMPAIDDPEALYLAMLLHDTGKGGVRGQENDGGIAAERVCERLGLKRARTEMVSWLVRHHLALSDFAQKRDIADPDTVAAFARIVESPERLRALLVLTVADIRAVGPGVWNGWKGQLMRELYAATEAVLRGVEGSDPATTFRRRLEQQADRNRQALVHAEPAAADFAASLGDAYFVSEPAEAQARHARLVEQARLSGAAAFARPRNDRNAVEIALAALDRKGLFADVATVLANHGADVIEARVFTTADGVALDIFSLQDARGAPFGTADPGALERVCRSMERAALGQAVPSEPTPVSAYRQRGPDTPTTVMIDNDSTASATIVEVSGRDRPGLLAALARALSDAGLSIASAHVGAYGVRAVDAFYVRAEGGEKLRDLERQAALVAALKAVFVRAPASPAPLRPVA